MANLITLSRFLLLLVVITICYLPPGPWLYGNLPLVIVMFITDGIDGWVARRRNEESQFGAVFDIAADRIVEYALWVVLADLDLAPIGVPLVFLMRGTIVDAIRSRGMDARTAPFDLMRSPVGRWLVKGGLMRILYALVKAITFCWLMMMYALRENRSEMWIEHGAPLRAIGSGLIGFAVILCLARGIPVILEFIAERRAGRLES